MIHKQSFMTYATLGAMGLIGICVFYIGYLLFQPFNPVTVTKPVKVLTKEVKAGEPVVLAITSCTTKQTTAHLDVELLASQGSEVSVPIFSIDNIPTKLGCVKDAPFPVDLTKLQLKLPSGDYKVRLHTIYNVNKIRTMEQNYDSEAFHYTADK